MEAALVVPADIGIDTLYGKVHLGETPCGVIDFLPVDGDVVPPSAMLLDELLRLHEHAARAAAGVVDAPLVWLQKFDQRAHHRAGREELATALALRTGEAREKVLV